VDPNQAHPFDALKALLGGLARAAQGQKPLQAERISKHRRGRMKVAKAKAYAHEKTLRRMRKATFKRNRGYR